MSFWGAARQAAGEQYGKENWQAYARREKLKRASGAIVAGGLVVFVVARTYADEILTGIMYGAAYGVAFIAIALFMYIGVRAYRRSVRTRRTYAPSTYTRVRTLYVHDDYVRTERVRTFMNESL